MTNLTTASIKRLFPNTISRSYVKGQIICYVGDKPQHIFFITKGHVRYYDIDEEGNEKILHLIGPNNIFPMLYAFGVTEDVGAFYSSLDEVDVIAVPLQDFRHAYETNIEFSNVLTRWFLTEINQLVYRINSLEKTEAKMKVLHALKYLAISYGHEQGAWQRLDFPVTQQLVADFTGLARETVSAFMHDLEEDGIIRSNRLHELDIKKSEIENIK